MRIIEKKKKLTVKELQLQKQLLKEEENIDKTMKQTVKISQLVRKASARTQVEFETGLKTARSWVPIRVTKFLVVGQEILKHKNSLAVYEELS